MSRGLLVFDFDLRRIYEAATQKEGAAALEQFSEKWDKRYPHISASWRSYWDEIVTFFKYPPEIRTMVHTTNPIESLNLKIKQAAQNKSIFPYDQALIKQVYLAVEKTTKKWAFRQGEWAMIYFPLMIYFRDRLGERTKMRRRGLHRISDTSASPQKYTHDILTFGNQLW